MINYLNDIITQDIKPITNHAIQWQMVVMVQAQSHIVINTKTIMFKNFP
jgi:hypothetical protein